MKIIKLLAFIYFMLLPLALESHSLEGAINSKERDPKNALRDEYRNPYETLTFFKIESDMTVVELSPGGGWYTEILANYLHDPGYLIAAHFDPNSERSYFKKSRTNFEKKLSSKPMYESVKLVNLFSTVLRKDLEDYYLVTPVEKVLVKVDLAPYKIVDFKINDKSIILETNLNYDFELNDVNTTKLIKENNTSIPIVNVRNNIEGFFNRNTYYKLVDWALERNFIENNCLFLPSNNLNHIIGKIA